jgi:hypothetical protein
MTYHEDESFANCSRWFLILLLAWLSLAGCSEGVEETAVSTPTPPPEQRINITRSEYEQALEKWNSQGIVEYEITVGVSALAGDLGPRTIRVRGKDLEVVDYFLWTIDGTIRVTPTATETAEEAKDYTVEALFADVDDILTSGPFEIYLLEQTHPLYYEIEFDKELGYPRSIRSNSGPSPSGRELSDLFSLTKVEGVKVLKRSSSDAP